MMTDREKFWDYLKNGHQIRLKMYGPHRPRISRKWTRVGMDKTTGKQLIKYFLPLANKKQLKKLAKAYRPH